MPTRHSGVRLYTWRAMRSDVRVNVVESLDDAVVVTDGGRVVVAWNAAMERLTGTPRADALSSSIDTVCAALPAAAWSRPVALALAGDRGHGVAVAIESGDARLWIEPQWAPRADAPGAVLVLRDVTEARKHTHFMRALETVGHSLASSLELDEVLDTIVEKTREVMGADSAMVGSWDGRAETLTVLRASGRLTDEYAPGGIPLSGGPIGLAVREGRALTTHDILNDPRWSLDPVRRRHIAREGFQAVAVAPLVVKGAVHGALAVQQWTARTFTDDEMALLARLAEQAALALENARLYTESRRERREARALADTAHSLAVSLDGDKVAERIVEAVLPVFGAHASTLYRIAADGDVVAMASAGAARAKFDRGLVWPKGTGVVGRCAESRAAVWTRDVLADAVYEHPPPLRDAVKEIGSRAVLATPLNVKSQVVGVLAVAFAEERGFEPREVALLQAFADQGALALENAQLYASARDNLARLRDTQAQLVQAAKLGALGQLVSGVAHELNNPLSVIIGYGQLLLARDLPPPLRRPVDLMVSQGDRMAKIVRNLLYFARQRPPARTSVHLHEILEQTLALRLNQLALSSIEVRREYVEGLPAISADAHQLQQVFLNLLLNAEQAILSAGRSGEIIARTAPGPTPDTVLAQIVDDGPGIAAGDLTRVFEPFYTTKEVGQGTGLGLSVSYGIVQEHGGRLMAESRPGVTTFTVELPVRSARSRSAVVMETRKPLTGEGRLALVVEDEPAVLDLIVQLLTESGWSVDVAAGGKTGIERVQSRRYDLVISDVRMPEGGGDEFYRKAVAYDAALSRRFLFITGDTANPAAWEFLKGAKVSVLEKPFSADAFLDAVRAIAMLTASPSGA